MVGAPSHPVADRAGARRRRRPFGRIWLLLAPLVLVSLVVAVHGLSRYGSSAAAPAALWLGSADPAPGAGPSAPRPTGGSRPAVTAGHVVGSGGPAGQPHRRSPVSRNRHLDVRPAPVGSVPTAAVHAPAAAGAATSATPAVSPGPATSPSGPALAAPAPDPPSPAAGTPSPATPGSFVDQVVALTNAQRTANGCPALTVNATLTRVAQAHSQDMAARDFFDHVNPDGRSPFDRMSAAGYLFAVAAENIAAVYPTPERAVRAWMNSPGHRANILNCGLTQIGVGFATGGSYGTYWTQDFGTPRP